MSLKLLMGPSGSGKTHRLYGELIKESMEHPEKNYLIVVPEQFTMQTQKEIVMMHPNHGIMNIDVLSFHRLAHRIFDAAGGNDRVILDDTGKSLILRRVAAEREEELVSLKGNLHKPGYINEVKSVISEFLQYDIGSRELSHMIEQNENRPALQGKLKDLSILYEGFREFLSSNYITTEELLDRACMAAEKAGFLRKSEIVFDGFTGFTPVQNRFLMQLMKIVPKMTVTVLLGNGEDPYQTDGEQKLFHLSKKTVQSLVKLQKEAGIAKEEDEILPGNPVYRQKDNAPLSFLEQNLFRYRNAVYTEKTEKLRMAQAKTPALEAEWICREIKRLVSKEGYRYGDIAVILGDSEELQPELETSFARFKIPYFMDATVGILMNPFTEFLRASCEVLLNDFSYESVLRFLRTGFAGFSEEETDLFENYIRGLGIRGRRRYEQTWTAEVRGFTREQCLLVDELRARLREVFAPLADFMSTTKKYPAKECVTAFYQFVVNRKIQEKLKRYEEMFESQGNPAKAREYAQIYRYVLELFDQIVELLGREELTISEFADILDAGFGEMRVGIIPPGVDQVVAGDMQRTRLTHIKALFLMGVNDGYIPKNGGKGGIISEIDRETLLSQEVELSPTTRQQSYIQRLYLYMNLTKPSGHLYLSWSKTSQDGSALRPSYLCRVIQKMFPEIVAEEVQEEVPFSDLMTPEEGLKALVSGIQTNRSSEYLELYRYFKAEPDYADVVSKLTDLAFREYKDDPISRAVASVLYGKVLENSVTRLEQYASCAYAHFLKYGLRLKEREEFSFESRDMGTVFHAVLEKFSVYLLKSGYTWFDIPMEKAEEFVCLGLSEYTQGDEESVLLSSARNRYMIERMERILKRTVKMLIEQVRKGVFVPNEYEITFSRCTDLSSIDISLSEEEKFKIYGRIDRMDTYETDDAVYVKVIDYKSGNQEFDLLSVYYGLDLQLVVYLDAALHLVKEKKPGKEVIPAGVLYYHVEDPVVERGEAKEQDVEAVNAKIRQALTMRGIVNGEHGIIQMMDREIQGKSDVIPVTLNKDGSIAKTSSVATGEELRLISDYVTGKAGKIGREILSGEIGIHPYELSGKSACDYCGYRSVCGFDESMDGFQKRKLKKMTREEIMEQVRKEVNS